MARNISPSVVEDDLSQGLMSVQLDKALSPSKQRGSEFPKERRITIYPDRRGRPSTLDALEIPAPFYNMREYDDYCIAVTGTYS